MWNIDYTIEIWDRDRARATLELGLGISNNTMARVMARARLGLD